MRTLASLAAACLLALWCASLPAAAQGDGIPLYGFRVVNTYPHDSRAYTQGLIFKDGFLYESTGRNGESTVRKVKLETGQVVQSQPVDRQYFAEGLTDWGDRLIQLTWQHGLAFVYDRATLKQQRTFNYTGEGWGLTQDGRRLILSDGSATIRFFSPDTYRETGRVTVKAGGQPVTQLNELEFIKGEIYANVWQTDRIARIAPSTGAVIGWIDLKGLLPGRNPDDRDAVLNGIAYDAAGDRLFVTGKWWPRLFEIKLERRMGVRAVGSDLEFDMAAPAVDVEPSTADPAMSNSRSDPTPPTQAGSIAGRATDVDGGVIPGATVIAARGNIKWTRVTNTTGRFEIEPLLPGSYDVSISLAGFRTVTDSITVGAGEAAAWNPVMRVGPLRRADYELLDAFVRRFTGSATPRDCGTHDVMATERDIERSIACAAAASATKEPFLAVRKRSGVDSQLAMGLVGGDDGVIFLFEYDSAPCGGPYCEPRFTATRCVEPIVRRDASQVWFACAPRR
jgi:glutaminyl-peptide cyclotransferase